jgi:hypothetical protein
MKGDAMGDAGPIRWHYTVVAKLRDIVRAGVINPTPADEAVGERPAVRFSANPFWEETASEPYRDADGVLRCGTRESTLWSGGGLARIGVRPADAPHDWKAYKSLSGISADKARQMYEAGIAAGAKTSEWFATFDPVPAAKWVAVEVWDGTRWVAFQRPAGGR